MKEPMLLKPNKLIIKCFGVIKYLLNSIGVIKIPKYKINNVLLDHRQQVWQKWIDWRWGNATMMVGSYDNLSEEHKIRCMEDCYRQAITFGIDHKYIKKTLNGNNFGWEVPLENK